LLIEELRNFQIPPEFVKIFKVKGVRPLRQVTFIAKEKIHIN